MKYWIQKYEIITTMTEVHIVNTITQPSSISLIVLVILYSQIQPHWGGKGFFHFVYIFRNCANMPRKLNDVQCESKKIPPPPRGPKLLTFLIFLTNGWEFLINFLHTYYTFLSMLLQIFIQLSPHSPILTKLCHIKCNYPVHIICSKSPPSAKMHALTSLRKSLIALLIVVCG